MQNQGGLRLFMIWPYALVSTNAKMNDLPDIIDGSCKTERFTDVPVAPSLKKAHNTWGVLYLPWMKICKVKLQSKNRNLPWAIAKTNQIENVRCFQSALVEHNQERSHNTRDYLKKLISSLFWNNTTTALFCNLFLFNGQLDELSSVLKRSISFLTFLPPTLLFLNLWH